MAFRFKSLRIFILLSAILLIGGIGYIGYTRYIEFRGLVGIIFMNYELPFKQKKFETIVDDYRSGKLIVENNAIDLPASFEGSVVWSKVYVTTDTDWGDALLFGVWSGKGSNMTGYVYFTNFADAAKPMPDSLELMSFVPHGETFVALVDVKVERAVAPGWFYVYQNLD